MTYLDAAGFVFGICAALTIYTGFGVSREIWNWRTWIFCFSWCAIVSLTWPVSVPIFLAISLWVMFRDRNRGEK